MGVQAAMKQPITVWRQDAPDGYGGMTYSAPEAALGFWQERAVEFKLLTGEVRTSRATVFLRDDVAIGDYLYFGTSAAADPKSVSGAYRVEQFSKLPNLRFNAYERKAYL